MNAPERDEEFQAFLKRRSVLPDALEPIEPPGTLDEKVLKEAREAIHAQRGPDKAARWAIPVALAATILLSLSVVLNISLNTHRPASTSLSASKSSTTPPADSPTRPAASTPDSLQAASPSLADRATSASDAASAAAPRNAGAAASQAPTVAPGADPKPALSRQAEEDRALSAHPQDPRVWLQLIAKLRAQGKSAQADAEMQRFRAAFPAYPLAPPSPGAAPEPPRPP